MASKKFKTTDQIFLCFNQSTGRPKSQCEQHRDSLQSGGPDGRPSVGAYIPQCDSDGLYQPQQVGSARQQYKPKYRKYSTGYFWMYFPYLGLKIILELGVTESTGFFQMTGWPYSLS